MLRHVTLVRTDVSEELSTYFITVTRIGELGTLAVTSNRSTLRRNTKILFLHSVRRLLVTAKVPSSPILVTVMEGGAKFFRNVGSYKSHSASHPRGRYSS
jgi:hypothetical protein